MPTIAELVSSASEVSSMGDKVAGFAIAQNLVWILAAVRGDLGSWLGSRRAWFLGGAVAAGFVYGGIEWCLRSHAHALIAAAYQDPLIAGQILKTSDLLFALRAVGAFSSSLFAGFAFLGMTRTVKAGP